MQATHATQDLAWLCCVETGDFGKCKVVSLIGDFSQLKSPISDFNFFCNFHPSVILPQKVKNTNRWF